ncbi:survival protein surE domain-containing protein [Sarocladium implicatum]|nr:survival protein surE domain-containing protein [Sarocladium implicatum]
MRLVFAVLGLGALAARGIRIVQTNDDGWAESDIRTLNKALIEAGHDVVLSAPAHDRSGSLKRNSMRDMEPKNRTEPCQWNSCPSNSGPIGSDPDRTDLNWVNSYPVTSIRYGIDTFGPHLWDGEGPELAISGPNNGWIFAAGVSWTTGTSAAAWAARKRGIPAIAFSGGSWWLVQYKEPALHRSLVYADLATNLTNKIIGGGKPYLPKNVFLNVNFPAVGPGCNKTEDVKWVLSRVNVGWFSKPDVHWCGDDRLPTERDVSREGCYASISIGDAKDKTTINDDRQAEVLARLMDWLVCLPK